MILLLSLTKLAAERLWIRTSFHGFEWIQFDAAIRFDSLRFKKQTGSHIRRSISIRGSVSTRNSTCEPGRGNHNHKQENETLSFFLCLQLCLCRYVVLVTGFNGLTSPPKDGMEAQPTGDKRQYLLLHGNKEDSLTLSYDLRRISCYYNTVCNESGECNN